MGAGEVVGAGLGVSPPTAPPVKVGAKVRLVEGVRVDLSDTEGEGVAKMDVEGVVDVEKLEDIVALVVLEASIGVKEASGEKLKLTVQLNVELSEKLTVRL